MLETFWIVLKAIFNKPKPKAPKATLVQGSFNTLFHPGLRDSFKSTFDEQKDGR